MNVAICDDNMTIHEQLHNLLSEFSHQYGQEIKVFDFMNAQEVLDYIQDEKAVKMDLLLLDIEMDGLDGIALNQYILKNDKISWIVYISNFVERMSEAFSEKTLGFISKPIDQAVMNYLDEIAHLFHFDKQYFYTGNQIIDILLTNLTEKARENNITVNIEGIIPKDLNVDSVDLTIICYNLLQNALEATILEKNDFFSVSCSIKNQQFIFVVKNKVSNEISIENGLIKSQKADEKNHGLGLKNVRDAVERSKGISDINVKNQLFIARVVLPLD